MSRRHFVGPPADLNPEYWSAWIDHAPPDLWWVYRQAAARAIEPRPAEWLARHWPTETARRAGIVVGVGRVREIGRGRGEVAEDGAPCVLIPAWPGLAPGAPDDLVDLVAWLPGQRRALALAGAADVLGEGAVSRAGYLGEALEIFASPLDWARAATPETAGCHGLVVLDWTAPGLPILLRAVGEILAPDEATGRVLLAVTIPSVLALPQILVPAENERAAA